MRRAIKSLVLMLAAAAALVLPTQAAPPAPGTPIANQAAAVHTDPLSGLILTNQSATVMATIQATPPPAINFFSSDTFGQTAIGTAIGTPLFVQATAPFCHVATGGVASVHITLTSTMTRDNETFLAAETAPGSGQYRILPNVPTRDAHAFPPTSGNGILETLPNDTIIASLAECGGTTVTAVILVDPNGVVFDSANNQPVAGATVTLIDVTGQGNGGHAGQPARVLGFDGVTPVPATVVTGPDGRFNFPLVASSTYRYQVSPPAGYRFPSQVPLGNLPPGRRLESPGSFGGNFTVTAALGPVQLDVPLDPPPATASLFVEKTASVAEAEIGDLVTYAVKVKNAGASLLTDVILVDDPPVGFAYQKHTARLNNTVAVEPQPQGAQLQFQLGALPAGATATVTYRLRVGSGALQGNGKNQAQAHAPGPPPVTSNVAVVKVKLSPGVFDDKGIIFGKVFVDRNHNQIQDDGEPGIPGVRIYLEDGTYAITDSEGKYSLYGLNPRTHVLKVDETTLPRGWKFAALTPRHNARGTLCLVDLHAHELRKINFADVAADPQVLAQVAARHAKGDPDVAEVQKTMAAPLTVADTPQQISDVRAQPAAGLVGAATMTNRPPAAFSGMLPDNTLNSRNSDLPARADAAVPAVAAEMALSSSADNTLDFVGLADQDTLPIAQANVWVKGPLGARLLLQVNGQPVSVQTVGKRVRLAAKQLEAWQYIGVGLRAGPNTLQLAAVDSFGNARGSKSITVTAPGKLGRLKITLPDRDQPADGVTPARLSVAVLDDRGVPVTARTPVTLEASCGRWAVKDLDPSEPGVQSFITGGRAEFVLLPPGEPGLARIVVSSGILRAEASLPFLPDLRPLVAAGVIETRVNFRHLDLSALSPSRHDDGFEEELRHWSFSADNGNVAGGVRGAVFLKGKIKGDYLLTLAYDSDKPANERLFRDIQPDTFYPVYGDSSVRGFDAQSTSRLYVRIDKRRCYLLYGDYTTQSDSEARGLGNYSRSLTGVKEHYETSRVKANAWASYDTTSQVIKEFPADGTSGPYFFSIGNALENSEKVEIVVRDRNQPAVILKVTPLQRFADYEFEPFSGRLLFKAPIPSLDQNLNPISIRVTFEVDQGGGKFWVTGADAQVKLTQWWEVGGATIHDFNLQNHYQLNSVNSTLRLTEHTFVIGEVAQSDSDAKGTGSGGRIELRHNSEATDLRIFAAHVETNFDNTASVITAGRQEIGGKISQKLTLQDRLTAEAIDTRDLATGGENRGVVAGYEHTFDCKLKLEIGGRHSDASNPPSTATAAGTTPNHVNTVRARLTTPVPGLPKANVYGEFENDVDHTDRRAATIGGDYQVANKTRAYVRHEFLDALGSPFELNSSQQNNRTVVGLETEYMKDGHLFNEYRVRDATSGAESEAAVGLRNAWQLGPGLRANTSFERVNPITGRTNNLDEATAATLGAEYTGNPLATTSGRIEVRTNDTDTHWLNTLAYARKLDDDWTMLAKSILNYDDRKSGAQGDLFQSRLQLGVAWRETRTDVWNALGKYEYKYEDDQTDPRNNLRRQVHILTLQVNYQPCRDLTVSGRYAPKLVVENDRSADSTSLAQLVAGRVMYTVAPRWSVGVNGSVLFNGQFHGVQYGAGPEVGFRVHDNVWLDAGYNVVGFHDRDLSQENYTDQGFYFGMRMTFDEHLLDGLRGAK